MTTKKFDEYYWIDVKKSVEKSAEALRGFNKAAGQFGYDATPDPSSYDTEQIRQFITYIPQRMERRDWSAEHREIIGNTWDHTLLTPSPVDYFNELYIERLKQAVESPVYMIPDGLTRDKYLRDYFGDWRVEKPFDEC